MLTDVMEWLALQLATALTCTVVKGFPTWNRTASVPPIASLELFGLGLRPGGRVGQPPALARPQARVTLFGKNEPDLWRLAQLLGAWLEANPTATVNGARVGVALDGQGQRYETQTGAEQEQYGLAFILAIAW